MLEEQPDLGGRENRDWGRLWVKDQCWAGAGWGPQQGVGVLLQFTGKEAELLSGTPVSVHVGEAAGILCRALSPVTQ